MLSFTADDHERVRNGELTVTWRLWKYAHVKPGRAYSTGFGHVLVEDVRTVQAAEVSDGDALECGLPDRESLIELVRSHTGAAVRPETVLYRVQFHYLAEPPARPQLPLEEIETRLARLDAASAEGPWTLAALQLIEANPGVVSGSLAQELGLERFDFKARVRKLKALGLTISLPVGYELSEMGQAYLDRAAEAVGDG